MGSTVDSGLELAQSTADTLRDLSTLSRAAAAQVSFKAPLCETVLNPRLKALLKPEWNPYCGGSGSRLPVHLKGAGKVAEIRSSAPRCIPGTLDESRVISTGLGSHCSHCTVLQVDRIKALLPGEKSVKALPAPSADEKAADADAAALFPVLASKAVSFLGDT